MASVSDESEVKIAVVFGPANIFGTILFFPHSLFCRSPLFAILPFESVQISENACGIDDKVILAVVNESFYIHV
jgi:hypothetical protein